MMLLTVCWLKNRPSITILFKVICNVDPSFKHKPPSRILHLPSMRYNVNIDSPVIMETVFHR